MNWRDLRERSKRQQGRREADWKLPVVVEFGEDNKAAVLDLRMESMKQHAFQGVREAGLGERRGRVSFLPRSRRWVAL